MSEESQGPSLGVHLIEVPIKRELTVFCLALIHFVFFVGKSKGHLIKCYYNDKMLMIFIQLLESQHAKKVVSNSPRIVDFAIGLDCFLGKFKLQRDCNQSC